MPGPDAATGGQGPPLNCYGELVRRLWEGCLPEIYQQIRDPGEFFAVIDEVIAQRIDQLADYLAGDDQHGEGYLAKVARPTAGSTRSNRYSASTCCSRQTRTGRRSWIAATRHGLG